MSDADHGAKSPGNQIADQHREIRSQLERIEQSNDLGQIAGYFEQLTPLLAEHFQEEESLEGLHDVIGTAAPHKLNTVDQLAEEHRELLNLVASIQQAIAVETNQPFSKLANQIAMFLDRMRDHEMRETELLSVSLSTDLGGSE